MQVNLQYCSAEMVWILLDLNVRKPDLISQLPKRFRLSRWQFVKDQGNAVVIVRR